MAEELSKQKKALIVTHRLGLNYGGMLQAYALQTVLKELGIESESTHFEKKDHLRRIQLQIKYIVRRILHQMGYPISDLPIDTANFTTAKTDKFVEEKISTVPSSLLRGDYIEKNYFVLISGSDQVWRQAYVPVEEYLFRFASKTENIIRISYAASFGRDDISEYKSRLKRRFGVLANQFNGLSVREQSGKDIIKSNWDLNAEQHVDPTMLLAADYYSALVASQKAGLANSEGELFAYILDWTECKKEILEQVSNTLKLQPFEVLPTPASSRKEFFSNLETFQLPPVAQWLKSFLDAEFIVTDSFHGTVFSIIFNKPFLAVGNSGRGLTRFQSLLDLFGLEDRLILTPEQLTEDLLDRKIDWGRINRIRTHEKERSLAYLTKHLD